MADQIDSVDWDAESCGRCNGDGDVRGSIAIQTCPACRGSGLSSAGEARLREREARYLVRWDCGRERGFPVFADALAFAKGCTGSVDVLGAGYDVDLGADGEPYYVSDGLTEDERDQLA